MNQISSDFWPPLKFVFYFQKCFLFNSETSAWQSPLLHFVIIYGTVPMTCSNFRIVHMKGLETSFPWKKLICSSSGGWDMAIWKKYGRTFFMNLLGCAEKQSICFFAQSNAKKTWTLAKTAAKQPKMIRFRIFKCLWNHLIKPLPKTFLKISKTQKWPQKRTPQNYQNPKII